MRGSDGRQQENPNLLHLLVTCTEMLLGALRECQSGESDEKAKVGY